MYRLALSISLKASVLSMTFFSFGLEAHAEVEASAESRIDADSTLTNQQLSQSFWQELSRAIERKDLKRARTLVEEVELNALSSDARYTAIAAISSAVPRRPSGCLAIKSFLA